MNQNKNMNVGQLQNENQNEIDKIASETINAMNNLRIVSKKVEITTNVIYTYEDGSTRTVSQYQTHEYK